jgi:ureidoacrylate peracid hydrolase
MNASMAIDVTKSALIVVDMQNDFCHSEGGLAKAGLDLSATQAMAPEIVSLAAAVKRAGLPTIYLGNLHDSWTDSVAWRSRHGNNATSLCRPRTFGAEFYAVSPQADDRIIYKHRYNAFHGTELDMILRAKGITTLIFTGVATNVCVETTAREAVVRDYRIVLVSDCLAGSSVEEHEASLRALSRYFNGSVVASNDIITALEGRGVASPLHGTA